MSSFSQKIHGAPILGSISGTVTRDGSRLTLKGVTVEVYSVLSAKLVGSVSTDASGDYAVAVAAGDYYVRTRTNSHYIDEIYDNQPCLAGLCKGVSPTTVTVSAGFSTTGINFALNLGGSISGRVTDADTLQGVKGVSVKIYNAFDEHVASNMTDSIGAWSVEQLPIGSYQAHTVSADYSDELYDGFPCPGGACVVGTGTEISVTAGTNTANINFALEYGGSIEGTVTPPYDAPIPSGGNVLVYDNAGNLAGTGVVSIADGTYVVSRLPAGDYTARTETSIEYLDYLYDAVACPNGFCDVTLGDPITVVTGAATTGIDFQIDSSYTVTGTVRDGGTPHSPGPPLEGVEVRLYKSSERLQPGDLSGTAITDAAGEFTLGGAALLEAVVGTSNSAGYIDELYSNVPCPGLTCSTDKADKLNLGAGGKDYYNINFYLETGGSVSGTVADEATFAPLENIEVVVYKDAFSADNRYRLASAITDAEGNYTVTGLPSSQSYRVQTSNMSGYIDETYDDRSCPVGACDFWADWVDVTAGVDTPDIDFALERGGMISGSIVDGATGLPIEFVKVEIDGSGGDPSEGYPTFELDSDAGIYLTSALPPGNYTVRTLNGYTGGYADEIWDDIPCEGASGCDLTTGSPVTVETGLVTTGVNFTLLYSAIGGMVTDAITGLPVTGRVRIQDTSRTIFREVNLDSQGAYLIEGLPEESYFVWTVTFEDHLDEVYDDVLCLSSTLCDWTAATPVAVSGGAPTTGIDFELMPGGVISGQLTKSISGEAVAGKVDIYNAAGDRVGNSRNSTGAYSVKPLPSGTYTAKANASIGIHDLLYDDLICGPDCDVTTGTPITVTAGAETADIDFAFEAGGSISGRITDQSTGAPIEIQANNARVKLFDQSGEYVNAIAVYPDSTYTTEGLPAGNYFITVSSPWTPGKIGFLGEAYDDVPCHPSCDPTTATPIAVSLDTKTTGLDIALTPAPGIGAFVNSGSATGSVLFYDADGSPAGSCALMDDNTGTPHCMIEELDPGTYYARTETVENYDKLYAGIPCPLGDCDVTSGTPIMLTAGSFQEISFLIFPGGSLSGQVTDSLSGTPIEGAEVRLYDSAAAYVTTEITDVSGTYLFDASLAYGGYKAEVAIDGYVGEIYNDVPCSNGICNFEDGSLIQVYWAQETGDIDFALDAKYFVGGNVTGLAGMGLVLQNNAGDDLAIDTNGPFTFATRLEDGSDYNVTVLTQPSNPNQTCGISNGTGTLAGADVADVTVSCSLYCNVNMVSGVTETATVSIEACEFLVLGPDFIATDGADVSASSGWEIGLQPGFLVEQGATLKANVCGQSLCLSSPDPMTYGCHPCVDLICSEDSGCCNLAFDQACVDKVDSICGLVCE